MHLEYYYWINLAYLSSISTTWKKESDFFPFYECANSIVVLQNCHLNIIHTFRQSVLPNVSTFVVVFPDNTLNDENCILCICPLKIVLGMCMCMCALETAKTLGTNNNFMVFRPLLCHLHFDLSFIIIIIFILACYLYWFWYSIYMQMSICMGTRWVFGARSSAVSSE